MKCVILAGGAGTRLWPVSRENYPKQFMEIYSGKSLLVNTAERLLGVNPNAADIVVSTQKDYLFHVKNHLESFGVDHIIEEPSRRNTAPAIALIIKYLEEKMGAQWDEIIFISPADHVIPSQEIFEKDVDKAIASAQEGKIVTFGITPTTPETGYGYIQYDKKATWDTKPITRFVEKPNVQTALEYLQSGDYLWNSGMFVFRLDCIKREFAKYVPEIFAAMELPYDKFVANFEKLPEIAFDYAIMEKTDCASVVPSSMPWSDVGSWESIFEVLPKDEHENVVQGNVLVRDVEKSLVWGGERMIVAQWMKDMLVIDTPDVLFIGQKGNGQQIKNIVNLLKAQHKREVEEHTTVYRPWGSYTTLEEGSRYKIKRITVRPGSKLSLQRHHHRSEHWIVVKWTAQVTRGDNVEYISENESVYISKTQLHRLENPGKELLEIIEIQVGSYLEEDDIVRIDDIYGR